MPIDQYTLDHPRFVDGTKVRVGPYVGVAIRRAHNRLLDRPHTDRYYVKLTHKNGRFIRARFIEVDGSKMSKF